MYITILSLNHKLEDKSVKAYSLVDRFRLQNIHDAWTLKLRTLEEVKVGTIGINEHISRVQSLINPIGLPELNPEDLASSSEEKLQILDSWWIWGRCRNVENNVLTHLPFKLFYLCSSCGWKLFGVGPPLQSFSIILYYFREFFVHLLFSASGFLGCPFTNETFLSTLNVFYFVGHLFPMRESKIAFSFVGCLFLCLSPKLPFHLWDVCSIWLSLKLLQKYRG